MRIRAFSRTPDFDSQWTSCSANTTYIFNHSIGAIPQLAIIEVAENSDGSGWRVPMLSIGRFDTQYNITVQTAIVRLNDTSFSLRTGNYLALFRYYADGTGVDPASGYCRIKLFDWSPDYDSGWRAISTSDEERDLWIRHDLGSTPTLVMLWIAENSDGSGWIMPAMSGNHNEFLHGPGIYTLNESWAVIKGGSASVAQFVDVDGTSRQETSGYIKFLAWK